MSYNEQQKPVFSETLAPSSLQRTRGFYETEKGLPGGISEEDYNFTKQRLFSKSDEEILNSDKRYKLKDMNENFKLNAYYYFIDPSTKKMKKIKCKKYSNPEYPEDCIFDNEEKHSITEKAWRKPGFDMFSMSTPFSASWKSSRNGGKKSRKYKRNTKKSKRTGRKTRKR